MRKDRADIVLQKGKSGVSTNRPDRRNAVFVMRNILLMLLVLIIGTGGLLSCGSTNSQVPLSVRERQTAEQADTLDDVKLDDRSVVDRKELRQQEDAGQTRREELEKQYGDLTNQALILYVNAQNEYFNGNYYQALRMLEEEIDRYEMADLYALKGSLHFTLGQYEQAGENWRRAVDINEDVVCDMYPGMQHWHEEIYNL